LITVCSKKLREDPNHKKALFIRASSYLKKGQFQQSIDDCNHLMQLDEMHAGAYYVRGCAFEKLEMVDKSIEDFTRVLQIDPHHINAAYARGACENKRGNFAKAIDDYNMALAIDKERTMSPSLNRRLPFRITQLNQSNINHGLAVNGSRMDSNSNSMLSYSSKAGYGRNMGGPGGDDQRGHSPIGGPSGTLNASAFLAEKNLMIADPNSSQLGGGKQNMMKNNNNTALMSPSVNASSRAGFMNETRISMQSSLLKSSECVRIHNIN
jgi:tetratricopeptide (TPR) repeat protein